MSTTHGRRTTPVTIESSRTIQKSILVDAKNDRTKRIISSIFLSFIGLKIFRIFFLSKTIVDFFFSVFSLTATFLLIIVRDI